MVLLLLIMIAGWWFFHSQRNHFSREALVQYGKGLSPLLLIVSLLTLPLVGFPLSLLLVLVGVRFGFWGGMAAAFVGVLVHNLVAYRLIHGLFRERLRARLEKSGYKIPELQEKNQAWFTALFAAVHGPPYAAKLYLLALTEVPLKTYLWAGVPTYVIFCAVPVGAGSAAFTIKPLWIYVFTAGMIVLFVMCRWLGKKLEGNV